MQPPSISLYNFWRRNQNHICFTSYSGSEVRWCRSKLNACLYQDCFSRHVEPQLLASLYDLFIAGSETTSTTILWALVFMVENPDVLRKIQDEIDANVARDTMITPADRGLITSPTVSYNNVIHERVVISNVPIEVKPLRWMFTLPLKVCCRIQKRLFSKCSDSPVSYHWACPIQLWRRFR